MARGALKSDIKPMQYAFMNSPDYAKGVIKRDDNYKHRADAETLFRRVMQADAGPALGRFAVALKAYQKADHNVEKGHKARKAELIDAFLTIPKEFRDLISTKADAKGLVNGEILMRGGRHRANPDDSGRITASFTTDNMTAANFGYRKYTLEKDVNRRLIAVEVFQELCGFLQMSQTGCDDTHLPLRTRDHDLLFELFFKSQTNSDLNHHSC